jgi:hypothetical protein
MVRRMTSSRCATVVLLLFWCLPGWPWPPTPPPSTHLLQEESTPSPFLTISSVRVTAALLLLCRSEAFAQSQPLEPLFPSPTDTISPEPSFPTTSTSHQYPGHSCHPCPPPHDHPHQAGARWSRHPATSTPSSVAPSFGAAQRHRS